MDSYKIFVESMQQAGIDKYTIDAVAAMLDAYVAYKLNREAFE